MNLSFAYLDESEQIRRVSFTVKETNVKINYSTVYMSGNGVYWNVEGENRYLTNRQQQGVNPSSISDASTRAAVEELFNFSVGGSHILKMDGTSNWHDPFSNIPNYSQGNASTIPTNFGKTMFAVSDGAYVPVCTFQWFNYLDQRHQFPLEQNATDVSFNGGFMLFRIPGITPHYPYTPSAAFPYPTFSLEYPAYLGLYLITIVDDVTSSSTYGQEIPCLMQCHSYQQYRHGSTTSSINARFTITDMRLIDKTITPNTDPNPTSPDPKKNSNINGWAGQRNTASASDSPTVAPSALKGSVNFGEHGIFLYKLDDTNTSLLAKSIWSANVVDAVQEKIFSPASGILSIHKLPYEPEVTSENAMVQCGGAYLDKTTFSIDVDGTTVFGLPNFKLNYTIETVHGDQITGGQEIESRPVDINPFFGSFLDFEPYTTVSLRLPFIGTVSIPTSAVMGGSIKVNYVLDNRNGNVCAQVLAKSMRNTETANGNGWVIINQWTGNCMMPAALTGNTQGGEQTVGAIKGFASSAVVGMLSGGFNPVVGVAGAALGALTAPRDTKVYGSLNTQAAILQDLTCRLIIKRPVDVVPGHYEDVGGTTVFVSDGLIEEAGLASNSGGFVSQYSGMTSGLVLGDVSTATEAEKLEIKRLFIGGVIV